MMTYTKEGFLISDIKINLTEEFNQETLANTLVAKLYCVNSQSTYTCTLNEKDEPNYLLKSRLLKNSFGELFMSGWYNRKNNLIITQYYITIYLWIEGQNNSCSLIFCSDEYHKNPGFTNPYLLTQDTQIFKNIIPTKNINVDKFADEFTDEFGEDFLDKYFKFSKLLETNVIGITNDGNIVKFPFDTKTIDFRNLKKLCNPSDVVKLTSANKLVLDAKHVYGDKNLYECVFDNKVRLENINEIVIHFEDNEYYINASPKWFLSCGDYIIKFVNCCKKNVLSHGNSSYKYILLENCDDFVFVQNDESERKYHIIKL